MFQSVWELRTILHGKSRHRTAAKPRFICRPNNVPCETETSSFIWINTATAHYLCPITFEAVQNRKKTKWQYKSQPFKDFFDLIRPFNAIKQKNSIFGIYFKSTRVPSAPIVRRIILSFYGVSIMSLLLFFCLFVGFSPTPLCLLSFKPDKYLLGFIEVILLI